VAVGSDGEARVVLGDGDEPGTLKVFARLQDAGGEWALEKSIELTPAMLHGHGLVAREVEITTAILQRFLPKFSINIETIEVERLPHMYRAKAHPTKLPWPPSLHACTYHA
jgi:hypothetical protein